MALLWLDHLSVIAPDLAEGVAHVRTCLDLDVPFGQRHLYMGTHNHLLQLGDATYLEIVALDPEAAAPAHPCWFGLGDRRAVRAAWDEGRRLRGWVARTHAIDAVLAEREAVFGRKVALNPGPAPFDISLPDDGSLPLDGAAPSIIDRRGKARSMETMADLGARLRGLVLEHPQPEAMTAFYRGLDLDRPPVIERGPELRYRARIETAAGLRELT